MAGGDGWRDIVRDAVAARAADARKNSRNGSQTAHISRVGFTIAAHAYLVRAARARGMSISSYIRRATMAVVAMDLRIEPTEIFAVDAAITPPGKNGRWQSTRDLDGDLFGQWKVRPDDSRSDHS
ncbi:ribbon-helix-helix DNA binding domain protein [Microbacterium phage Rudy]|uniref:DNA binding protein n=2 Tax=Squashvirus TaxID=2733215 RepID=A0A2U8UM28_9CAUD|nr:DNA binding protein [Microbacterium phage Squash]QIQ63603.1 ribbon-helix-helix DNA binding domain protein [Microbacterium phage Nike]QNL29987.1 ribbon-helix-helix DNA binding domain protein [Microbacterium phage Casend]QQO39199.1 ribbon-helix-helix DNA binding domain protein [Microbacterium phage Rudy]QQO39420.1 ribbon-helix-helix DNA binding domain protein [Microbacterium phage Namago]QQO39528.1 ribbon-helix-helix DNA binding domain protein [Microbacterium phage Phabia]QWY80103.1 ribbon-h